MPCECGKNYAEATRNLVQILIGGHRQNTTGEKPKVQHVRILWNKSSRISSG